MPSARLTTGTFRAWLVAIAALAAILSGATQVTAQEPASATAEAAPKPQHGIAIHGDIKYPPDFQHFDYVNPNAPKGGTARLAGFGTFDNLNPYILKGNTAVGTGLMFDTLLVASADEPSSDYGLVAESLEVPEDRSWVIFNLRPEARFHDGSPMTADDVVFSFNIIRSKGSPQRRSYYASVDTVEKLGERRVKFTFKPGDNRELPVILGSLPVLSKAYWENREFDRTTVEPPLASGPYRIDSLEPGRSITYRRVADYWARDLPVRRGQHNFDVIRYDYYRDIGVAIEGFKAGEFDLREENSAKNWATAYDVPAVRQGLIKKETLGEELHPPGLQGYYYNTRRPVFADRRVREALAYAFDFEWVNRQLAYGAFTRSRSYFSEPGLRAEGLPDGDELAILAPYRDRLPPEVFSAEYHPPSSDREGGIRANLLTALRLLKTAGWEVNAQGVLVNIQSGEPMSFEILLNQPGLERMTGPFLRNLKRLGINARMRTVDSSQYQNRMNDYDFDMTIIIVPQSSSPGNEQRDFFSSASATTPGTYNWSGISDPVVDELIELLIAAPDRHSLEVRTRALDRVLQWGFYAIPNYHVRGEWVVYWNKFGHPDITPLHGYQFTAWWIDPALEATVAARRRSEAVNRDAGAAPDKSPYGLTAILAVAAGAAGLLLIVWRIRRRASSANKDSVTP